MGISPDIVTSHGLSAPEYDQICEILGRAPNLTELGIFSVMWSEHCSYKSSRIHLKKLPTEGEVVIQGPGENAGVVSVGNDLAVVFKIESHNHPSYIEPYQGAATGVGGIIRDIFTMGARPIAVMDSLHFGHLDDLNNQHIMEGVVAGVAGYGNCMGIPTVGGEVQFQQRYSNNPIVNVFCLGLAPVERLFYACAEGTGNPVIYVGAKTGRDGIHGATMASEQFEEGAESKRPNVQIGDPFMEKLLLEACLEAMGSGAVIGIQDMGAAGLTCSTCEMGSKTNVGIEIELDLVPQREPNMTPYEIMLSESQERMLLVAERGKEEEVLSIYRRWDLDAVVIGEVTETGRLVVRKSGELVAEIPNLALTDQAPVYDRPQTRPAYLDEIPNWETLVPEEPTDINALFLSMAGSETLCSRLWVFRQYDYQVRTNTMVTPGSDAAVLRLKKGRGALAMTLDGNPHLCHLDPREGARLSVAEACRNLVCSGAKPLAATNCLNFASPENPEIMWQFVEAVEGIREACEAFGTPITGGNVSFYNETDGEGIFPTPVLGMVGKIDRLEYVRDIHFKPGRRIFLLGEPTGQMGGSAYLRHLGHEVAGPVPKLDLQVEQDLHERLLTLITNDLIETAHDVADGGLAFCLAESCFQNRVGVDVAVQTDLRTDCTLFGESPSRVVVSVDPDREGLFIEALAGTPVAALGSVTDGAFCIRVNDRAVIETDISTVVQVWENHFEEVFRH